MATIHTEGWPVQVLPTRSAKRFPISVSGHMVLVFKDDAGREYHINAGPENESNPFGDLDLRDIGSPLTKRTNVVNDARVDAAWRGAKLVKFGDRDPADVWDILLQHAQNIHNANFKYNPFSANSNTVIGALLDLVGVSINGFQPNPRGIMLAGFVGRNSKLEFDFAIDGTPGDDLLHGRGGNQVFKGMGGHDRFFGGTGNDTLFGGSGNDWMSGAAGNDLLSGGTGSDTLFGGPGQDVLRGYNGADLLNGGSGNDLLLGRSGNDTLLGETGNDTIMGGRGNDRIDAGSGNDTVDGGSGNDWAWGGRGNDTMKGGDGDDRLKSQSGDDVLHGGRGADRLMGGDGDDTFVFKTIADSTPTDGVDWVQDFEKDSDKIDLSALADGFVFSNAGLTGSGPSVALQAEDDNTDVLVDVDGDGAADMLIKVLDISGLDRDDFIL